MLVVKNWIDWIYRQVVKKDGLNYNRIQNGSNKDLISVIPVFGDHGRGYGNLLDAKDAICLFFFFFLWQIGIWVWIWMNPIKL